MLQNITVILTQLFLLIVEEGTPVSIEKIVITFHQHRKEVIT